LTFVSTQVKYFSWLEDFLQGGGVINEFDAATKLEDFRKENDLFQGLSFETISATGANAAIVHYSPSSSSSETVHQDQIYLCDSGAQASSSSASALPLLVEI
jgi:Xaa-Pro aminopeptidase